MSTTACSPTDAEPVVADAIGEPQRRRRALWVAWERHRRTTELARAAGVPLHEIVFDWPLPFRHVAAGMVTVALLCRSRPTVVFVQNPSVVLAALTCLCSRALGYRVIVDRHSNFDFSNTETGFFNMLSDFSIRRADLTIVTNRAVARLITSKGGRAFVLPDRLPDLGQARRSELPGRFNVAFVCTFSADEPLAEVIEAARLLPPDVRIFVTGDSARLPAHMRERIPANVTLTGFLSPAAYESLLASVDVVLELTKRPHTLLCGAYEAVSLGKPLIVSRTEALLGYFRQGIVATDNRPEAIAAAIEAAERDIGRLQQEIAALRPVLTAEWAAEFTALGGELDRLGDAVARQTAI